MKAILDTNLLVVGSLEHAGYEIAVSSLSWTELRFGIRKTTDPAERARRERRVARLRSVLGPGIPFHDDAAAAYETVCGLVLAVGPDPRARAIDLMIAATAVSVGAAVLTRRTGDFAGLDSIVPVVAA